MTAAYVHTHNCYTNPTGFTGNTRYHVIVTAMKPQNLEKKVV